MKNKLAELRIQRSLWIRRMNLQEAKITTGALTLGARQEVERRLSEARERLADLNDQIVDLETEESADCNSLRMGLKEVHYRGFTVRYTKTAEKQLKAAA